MNPKVKLLFISLSIFAASILLDRLFYRHVIFSQENYSSWDQFRWYNFEYQFRRLEELRKTEPEKKLILFVGSSVAQYSVQKKELTDELNKIPSLSTQLKDFEIGFLFHAAMLPADLYYYSRRIRDLDPYLVVYILNPADIDLERYVPPWEAGPNYSNSAAFHYMTIRRPLRHYYPGLFALKEWNRIDGDKIAGLIMKEVYQGLRFNDEWVDPVIYNWKAKQGPLKSYLNYQGKPVPEGIWREGHTGSCFTISREDLTNDFLLAEIPAKFENFPDFHLQFYQITGTKTETENSIKNPTLNCKIPADAVQLGRFKPKKTGWQNIPLSLPNSQNSRCRTISDCQEIFVKLSHVIDEKNKIISADEKLPVYCGRGLRLPGNFGLTRSRTNDYSIRRKSLEDFRLLNLTPSEYMKDFEQRVHPDNWQMAENSFLHQFNKVRLAKYYLNWTEFSEIYQIHKLKEFNKVITSNAKILIINNPENPLTLDEYGGSDWYRGYLDYLKNLPEDNRGVYFVNFRDELKMNLFIDAHHLTYFGLEQMAPKYAEAIANVLKESDYAEIR